MFVVEQTPLRHALKLPMAPPDRYGALLDLRVDLK